MIDRYLIIIGAMKAGTTSLFDYLARHPAIAPSAPKEPAYFAFDDVYRRGPDWYRSLFRFDPSRHAVALEASTDYTKHPFCSDVPARMAAFGAQSIKLVYLLRHPLRRIESHALYVQQRRREVGRIDSERPDHSLDAGVSPVSLAISRYAEQLDQYEEWRRRGDLMILSLEAFSADPSGVGRDVCRFAGVDPDLLPAEAEQRNAGDDVRRAREVNPLWRAAATIAPLRAAVKSLVPSTTLQRLRLQTRKALKAEGRFKLRPDEEAKLLDELRPDLRRLQRDYGFDAEKEWGIAL